MKAAILKFKEAGVPWRRPPDYYAEMVKSDQHMQRVKQQMLSATKAIEQKEER